MERVFSTKQGLTKSCKNETLDGYTTFAISPPEACGGDGFAGLWFESKINPGNNNADI